MGRSFWWAAGINPSWEHILEPFGIRGEEAWELIHLLPAVSGCGLLP